MEKKLSPEELDKMAPEAPPDFNYLTEKRAQAIRAQAHRDEILKRLEEAFPTKKQTYREQYPVNSELYLDKYLQVKLRQKELPIVPCEQEIRITNTTTGFNLYCSCGWAKENILDFSADTCFHYRTLTHWRD